MRTVARYSRCEPREIAYMNFFWVKQLSNEQLSFSFVEKSYSKTVEVTGYVTSRCLKILFVFSMQENRSANVTRRLIQLTLALILPAFFSTTATLKSEPVMNGLQISNEFRFGPPQKKANQKSASEALWRHRSCCLQQPVSNVWRHKTCPVYFRRLKPTYSSL